MKSEQEEEEEVQGTAEKKLERMSDMIFNLYSKEVGTPRKTSIKTECRRELMFRYFGFLRYILRYDKLLVFDNSSI